MSKSYEIKQALDNIIREKRAELIKSNSDKIAKEFEKVCKGHGILVDYLYYKKISARIEELSKQRDDVEKRIKDKHTACWAYNWEEELKTEAENAVPAIKRLKQLSEELQLKVLLATSKQLNSVFESIKAEIGGY